MMEATTAADYAGIGVAAHFMTATRVIPNVLLATQNRIQKTMSQDMLQKVSVR